MLLLQLPRLFSSQCLILSNRLTKPFIRKKFASTARIEMETVNTTERLRRLRELMRENKIDVYSMFHAQFSDQLFYLPFPSCSVSRQSSVRIYCTMRCPPRSDPSAPSCFLKLIVEEYISGFSGSDGTAVVTLEKAALATDGRYFNQASKQLDSNWDLLKQGLEDVPTWQEWFLSPKFFSAFIPLLITSRTADQSVGNKTVGVDPTVITARENMQNCCSFQYSLLTFGQLGLVNYWIKSRRKAAPALSVSKII